MRRRRAVPIPRRRHVLIRRRHLAVLTLRPRALTQPLAAVMAAEVVVGPLMAEAAVVEHHMVAEAAEVIRIVNINTFRKGPPRSDEAGLFLS